LRLSRVFSPIVSFVVLASLALAALPAAAAPAPAPAAQEARFFAETNYGIANDAVWGYFSHRGGVRTFGFPVSRLFVLDGFSVQVFQRGILQLTPDGAVRPLNMLDPDLMPYTQVNFSAFPGADDALKAQTPQPGDPDYGTKIVQFVHDTAPDSWNGLPVNFAQTFFSTVSCQDAFGDQPCQDNLLPLLNLELWGAPISAPAYDPANHDFVYQRFQRGIMHFDKGKGVTQGILLADYFKSILTNQNLPPDLGQAAQGSKYFAQYDPQAPNGIARPDALPNSNLTNAFQPMTAADLANGSPPSGTTPPPAGGGTASTPPPSGNIPPAAAGSINAAGVYQAASPEYGMVVQVFGAGDPGQQLDLVKNAGFSWIKLQMSWKAMEPQPQQYDWTEADRIVKAATDRDIKIIARLSDVPDWAIGYRAKQDGETDSPPDNYQDYFDFVHAFAGHFKKKDARVDAIEIWNEPNIHREWGMRPPSPQEYTNLLKGSYAAAKDASADVTVLAGSFTPTGTSDATAMPDDDFLRGMYAAGAAPYFDVLSAHAPGYKAPPEMDPGQVSQDPNFGGCAGCTNHRFFSFRHIEDLHAIMTQNGDTTKQVWVTEFGWTSDAIHPDYSWFKVSEQDKADYLVRAYQYAHQNWSPWIGVMTAWTLSAPYWTQDNEQYWWALDNPDGSPRPAYTALQQGRASGALP
jgi:hypothetical protein